MTTVEVPLPDPLKNFVDTQVAVGGYRDAGEYVQALLREAYQAQQRAAIEPQLVEGVDAMERGDAGEMTSRDWERLRSEYQQRVQDRQGS